MNQRRQNDAAKQIAKQIMSPMKLSLYRGAYLLVSRIRKQRCHQLP